MNARTHILDCWAQNGAHCRQTNLMVPSMGRQIRKKVPLPPGCCRLQSWCAGLVGGGHRLLTHLGWHKRGLDGGRERLVWLECQLALAKTLLVTHTFLLSLFPNQPTSFHHIYLLSFRVSVRSPPTSWFFHISPNYFPAIELLNILNFSNFCNLEMYTIESLNNCICLQSSRDLR